jgi:hypothetical protein
MNVACVTYLSRRAKKLVILLLVANKSGFGVLLASSILSD